MTIIRPTGTVELIGNGPGGAIIGTGDIWADDSDETYAVVDYQYTSFPDAAVTSLWPAVPDATAIDVESITIRVSADPGNIFDGILSAVYLFEWPTFSFVTIQQGGFLFVAESPTTYTLTYNPENHDAILALLQTGSLGIQFKFSGGITGTVPQYFYVYEASMGVTLGVPSAISGANGGVRRGFW